MAEWDYRAFWEESIRQLRSDLGEQDFSIWLNKLEYSGGTEKGITIVVPSNFYRDEVKKRYQNAIENKIRELSGRDLAVLFEVMSKRTETEPGEGENSGHFSGAGEKRTVNTPDRRSLGEEKSVPHGALPAEKKSRHPQLREDYSFNKYVIGENNLFAANAALAIGKNPGVTSYNPFLIYGGVGLGKTHLMQAIGNYIHENSNVKIIYMSAENFTNDFIEALHEQKMTAFRNKYRHVDVLLIDDIHFLEKKDGTQEELFYTFDELYHAKKQIVFTCDRPVSELKNLTERLKSRFEWGLKVDLQPPNFETRCAILKKKCEDKKVKVPDNVTSLIANKISTNVRDLEGALNTLIAYSELVGKPVTLEIAQQQLKDVFFPKQSSMSLETIIRVVAEDFHLSPNDLKGKKRTSTIVFPRQLAMFIAREITEYSTTEIGQTFGGRDHTTVMYSCQKIEEQIRSNPTLDSTIESLKRTIKEYNAKT
ncbi:MAG: chromosomal replication initiator protein DnaA [Treponema sp.]|jgi:chromosomal replication initiator protein|nr:chromosomal replication initiator protein DnaA [Treponema sp.]